MTELIHADPRWQKRWPAPAKLNLMLRIVGQREDGYHLLQTVFQFIELFDWITFTPSEESRVWLESPLEGVPEANDLTVRAASLLKKETGYPGGVKIAVEKNLPMGGGLGGGSSDAATTLVVLNELWQLGLSKEKLMQLGLTLGADVPIFVFGYTSWAEGVGESLKQIDVAEQWVVVIKPQCNVSTQDIFQAKELTRDSKPIKISDFLEGSRQNDCLRVVLKLYPEIGEAMSSLSQFAEARLTGTGACVFAQFDSESAARKAFHLLGKKWEVYLAKGINKSPLYLGLGVTD